MIFDYQNMFSKDQAVTATAVSSNVVDLGPGDAGPSERLSLFVSANSAYTGGGTITISLQTADVSSMTAAVTIAGYPIDSAPLAAGGKLLATRLPHGCKRYLQLSYAVAGSLAAGTITAGLVLDVQAESPIPTGPSGI